MALQGTIGNKATHRLLRGGARTLSAPSSGAAPMVIQPKLSVGAASDRYEEEANLVARQIVGSDGAATAPRRAEPSALLQRSSSLEGGEVDSALESRIQQSQSGGDPLPRGIRDTLEPRLGVDLRGVRVHTGGEAAQLSSSLGATAFTHKNHIFYGANQSPHDLGLTAHEVVHTIQQGATPSRGGEGSSGPGVQRSVEGGVIQRNVGFEFESGNTKVRYPVDHPQHPDKVYKAKDTLAKVNKQFEVTTDSGDLEIVTHDFPETQAGKKALNAALTKIELYCGAAVNKGERGGRRIATIEQLSEIAKPTNDTYKPYQIAALLDGNIVSHPQATAGVELNKVYKLLDDLSNKDSDTYEQTGWDQRRQWSPTIVGVQDAVSKADLFMQKVPDDKNYDKLKGLVAQIYSIILVAKKWRYKQASYAKYLMPIMQRTDFGSIYAQLEEHEKEVFAGKQDELLAVAGVGGGDLLFPGGIEEWGKQNNTIKIQDFLSKMMEGKGNDVLSNMSNAGSGWAGEDNIGDTLENKNRRGAIFELRRLKNNVPYTEFRSFGLGIFDMITMLNQNKKFNL